MSRRAFVPMLVAVAVSIGCTGGARESLLSNGDVAARDSAQAHADFAGVPHAPRAIITLRLGDTLSRGIFPRFEVRTRDSVLTRDADGRIKATGFGSTTIVAQSMEHGSPPDTIVVRVMSQQQITNSTIPEVCPNSDSAVIVKGQPYHTAVASIHEYHDCQRLIRDGAYGPPVGIFAHENVARYSSPSSFTAGLLAALIVNFPVKKYTSSYAPLGLKPGTSCLVLRWADSAWQGAIVNQTPPFSPTSPNYGDCPDSMSWKDVTSADQSLVTYLSVKTQRGVDPWGHRVVPPVARWDWDRVARVNYIGIKCGAEEWCEIGRKNFTPSLPRKVQAGELIKGYYDEQLLADRSGKRPSNVFGTILPVIGNSTTSSWQGKATVSLRTEYSGPPDAIDHYRKRFHLVRAPDEPGRNSTPPIRVDTALDEIRPVRNAPLSYLLRMNGTADTNATIQYRGHPNDVMVRYPIVRWRWLEKDETKWFSCPPDGCCEEARADM